MADEMMTASLAHRLVTWSQLRNSTTLEDVSPPQVAIATAASYHFQLKVVSSELERWMMLGLGLALTIWTWGANSLLTATFVRRFRNNQERDVNYVILLAIVISETVVGTCGGVMLWLVLILEGRAPDVAVQLLSNVIIASYFCIIYLIAMVSFERYIYFCHPFRYERVFSVHKVLVVISSLAVAVHAWVLIPALLYGRKMLYANLYCMLQSQTFPKTYIGFCILPSALIVLYSCSGIVQLVRQRWSSPLAGSKSLPTFMTNRQIMSLRRPAKLALSVVLLLSGHMFVTYIPTSIATQTVLSYVTWEEVDSRAALPESVLLRVCALVKAILAPAISPLLLLYVNKPLRKQCMQWFSYRNAVAPMYP